MTAPKRLGILPLMITQTERELIGNSWRLVVPIADTAADLFYRRLFELRPQYRELFSGDLERQKGKLIRMLSFVVKALDFPPSAWKDDVPVDADLLLVLLALGRRHSELYDVADDAYGPTGEALLWALNYGLGEAFTDEVKDAWLHVYTLLAATMRMGRNTVEPADPSFREA